MRTEHLVRLKTPALIVQGTRDIFGTCAEVSDYELSPAIEFSWVEDGDHDLKVRKSVTGLAAADRLRMTADAIASWIAQAA